jgi:tetratricopeptide (TPR) repeat protein
MEEGRALNALADVEFDLHLWGAAWDHVEQGLRLCRLTGNRRDEAYALLRLGWLQVEVGAFDDSHTSLQAAAGLFHRVRDGLGESLVALVQARRAEMVGENGASCELAQRAFTLARAVNSDGWQAIALIALGHAAIGIARWEDAEAAYRASLALCLEQDWPQWAVSARAGLARVALARGDVPAALAQVESVLTYADAVPALNRTFAPIDVYLTCIEVLRAAEDTRAGEVLQTAHHLLQTWADHLDDPDRRRSFLENVPAHRDLLAEVDAARRAASSS